ncbi:hypothetical protein ZHAS_00006725 [Anopheles sinensis]|uniref:Uncharacterized protein n=1 Tax=Anopheles sinensis TaxID=74873 RepID=A0A084VM22_ANOSI|nr:hypothetical protein ZHAS_00006725 [Anopheles sinensis]
MAARCHCVFGTTHPFAVRQLTLDTGKYFLPYASRGNGGGDGGFRVPCVFSATTARTNQHQRVSRSGVFAAFSRCLPRGVGFKTGLRYFFLRPEPTTTTTTLCRPDAIAFWCAAATVRELNAPFVSYADDTPSTTDPTRLKQPCDKWKNVSAALANGERETTRRSRTVASGVLCLLFLARAVFRYSGYVEQ